MAEVNLISLIDRFNCDGKCREALEQIRWPAGVCYTRCGDISVHELPKHNCWECKGCGYQFSVTSGIIMHDSHLPLRKWFLAIYLMCESKKGISANQLHRTLGIAYREAIAQTYRQYLPALRSDHEPLFEIGHGRASREISHCT